MIQKSALEVTLRFTDPIGNQMSVKACVIKVPVMSRGEYEVPLSEIECVECDILKGTTIRCRHGMEFLIAFRDGLLLKQFQESVEND